MKTKPRFIIILLSTTLTSILVSILTIPLSYGVAFLMGIAQAYHSETLAVALLWASAIAILAAYNSEVKNNVER